jgi:hypothetical protein
VNESEDRISQVIAPSPVIADARGSIVTPTPHAQGIISKPVTPTNDLNDVTEALPEQQQPKPLLDQSDAISMKSARPAFKASLAENKSGVLDVTGSFPSFHKPCESPFDADWLLEVVVHSVHELPLRLTGEVSSFIWTGLPLPLVILHASYRSLNRTSVSPSKA